MTKLIRTDTYKGFKFKNYFQFIDDTCNINDDSELQRYYAEIYPKELEIDIGNRFLEIDITIKDDIFVYKLFDKRDDFPFFIVRMPDLGGNIPSHVFYGSVMSEILRIARATLLYQDFLIKCKELFSRMISQGTSLFLLLKQVKKVLLSHSGAFNSFKKTVQDIQKDLL